MKKPLLILTSTLTAVAVIAVGIAGYNFYKNANTRVQVFPVSMISTAPWGSDDSSYGIITTDLTQDIYLKENQILEHILVHEGDTVSVGTPLLQLDNTLANLDLEMQALSIDNIDLQIESVNRDIHYLETAAPVNQNDLNILDNLNVSLQPEKRILLSSPGTELSDPDAIVYRLDNQTVLFLKDGTRNIYTVKCAPETIITSEFLYRIMNIDPETGRKLGEPLVLFLQIPSMDKRIYLDGYTFRIPEEFYEMTLYDFMQLPDIPVTESSSESYSESNPYNGISSSERDKQLKEKKNQLTNLTIDRKEAVLKYEKMRREVSSGTILSTVNGQVKITGDVENVVNASVPLITVTSQDGFYLKGTVNELKLDQIEVGHTVTVTNMETGMIAEAKITSISDYPVSDNNNSYGTNPNTSNYPFTAYLEESAGFKNNQSVSISVQTGETSSTSAIYIPLAYIRDEGGETFVYIADENNRLKKQVVDTGAILYGYYQEIKSGLTSEDLITFPYGKNVKEGVKTETVDSPSMY